MAKKTTYKSPLERLEELEAVSGKLVKDARPKSLTEEAREKALDALAIYGGRLEKEDDVIFQGTQFILPETTKLAQAIEFLEQKMEEDEEQVDFSQEYLYRPYDGARALGRALKRAFGFSRALPTFDFFGKHPPELKTIKTSLHTTEQVPWGQLGIPGLDNTTVTTSVSKHKEYGLVFQVYVTAPKKYKHHIQGLFNLIQEELETDSIYRGQAIDGQSDPDFIDTTAVNPDDVVFTQDAEQQLMANLWSPIIHAEALAALNQSGKRSILFEGPYGTGKTLAALLTAQIAVMHGRTFIMCRPGKDDLNLVMQTARIYQPSVVFYEDLDTISAVQDDHLTKLLDMFDGIQAKGTQIIMVLTTNHVEMIHKGMIRPGRLDAIIHIGPMDRVGVEKLAKRVIGDVLDAECDFDKVHEAMEGMLPAFVREVFDRAVRYSVARNNGELGNIGTSDLVGAALGLRPQLELMEGASDRKTHPTLETGFAELIDKKVTEKINETYFQDSDDGAKGRFKLAVIDGQ